MRTALLFLLFVAMALSYHFFRITCIQDEQIGLLREQVGLARDNAKSEQNIAWMMAEGTRMCANDLVEAPRWLGLLTKKREVVAMRNRKTRGGIGGGP